MPQIRTVADAERAVAWCRYPPVGLRGIAPRRASGYGRGTAAYMAAANALVTCCIQIETREALADLDAILAVPGIDTVLIGPNDLAAALGHIGELDHPEVETAIRHIGERGAGGRRPGRRLGGLDRAGPDAARAGLRLGDRRLRLRVHGRGRRRRGPRGPGRLIGWPVAPDGKSSGRVGGGVGVGLGGGGGGTTGGSQALPGWRGGKLALTQALHTLSFRTLLNPPTDDAYVRGPKTVRFACPGRPG